jgi:hypothetical protein
MSKKKKWQLYYISGSQKPKMGFTELESRNPQGCVSFRGLRKDFFLTFPASKGCPHSFVCGLFLCLQSKQCQAKSLECHLSGSPSSASIFLFPGALFYSGSTYLIQDKVISSSQGQRVNNHYFTYHLLPLDMSPNTSTGSGIKTWTFLRGHYSASHTPTYRICLPFLKSPQRLNP